MFIYALLLVSVLAETSEVQQELLTHGIVVQNVGEVEEVFSIQPASSFAKILSRFVFNASNGFFSFSINLILSILTFFSIFFLMYEDYKPLFVSRCVPLPLHLLPVQCIPILGDYEYHRFRFYKWINVLYDALVG